MNSMVFRYLIRFIVILIIQVFILRNVHFSGSGFLSNASLFIYPIFIFLLPINIPRSVILITAFVIGLTIDVFYDSIGIHAATSVFVAFLRMYVLRVLEPTQGFKTEGSISAFNYGMVWFSTYAATLLFIHLFTYFSISAFSFVFIVDILLKTILSFVFSFFLIVIHQIILKVE